MSPKKKRRYREKKPHNLRSIMAAIPATVSFALFLLVIVESVINDGKITRILAGLGMIFFIVSIIEFYYGFREYKKDDYSTVSRRVGVILPLVSFLLWGALFVIGIFF
ncbi:MAG: hypothetical protein K5851_02720 [Lachnospiraceae bacterium]|nr:hypothetical protein [Lachnospiraceae bacterium]